MENSTVQGGLRKYPPPSPRHPLPLSSPTSPHSPTFPSLRPFLIRSDLCNPPFLSFLAQLFANRGTMKLILMELEVLQLATPPPLPPYLYISFCISLSFIHCRCLCRLISLCSSETLNHTTASHNTYGPHFYLHLFRWLPIRPFCYSYRAVLHPISNQCTRRRPPPVRSCANFQKYAAVVPLAADLRASLQSDLSEL